MLSEYAAKADNAALNNKWEEATACALVALAISFERYMQYQYQQLTEEQRDALARTDGVG